MNSQCLHCGNAHPSEYLKDCPHCAGTCRQTKTRGYVDYIESIRISTEEHDVNHPYIGEILWDGDDPATRERRLVIRVEGTMVFTVPAGTVIHGGHQGNYYDVNGERKYAV